MRQTTNKNLTKQILTLALAFVMVFTGMGIGSWGVDTAWATGGSESTPTSRVWDGTATTAPQTDENGVYQIGTGAELAWFAGLVNGTLKDGTTQNQSASAVLTNDIDLGSQEWTPIGNKTTPFKGSIDGQNHRIRNLSITQGSKYLAFIGYAEGSKIQNLTVDGEINIANATSIMAVAGIVAYFNQAYEVINCVNEVNITLSKIELSSNESKSLFVGGICAQNNLRIAAKIIGSTNKGNIACSASVTQKILVAGIVGSGSQNITIENCLNTGEVNATINGGETLYASGIACFVRPSSPTISNCVNLKSVNAAGANGVWATAKKAAIAVNLQNYPINSYYVEGTANSGIAGADGSDVADETSGIVCKDANAMKERAVLDALNSATSTSGYAVTWEAGTDGYPQIAEVYKAEGIKSFVVAGVSAAIDSTKKLITATLPEGTELTNLTPTIECFGGATVSPASGVEQDFSEAVTYTVGNLIYTVKLSVAQPTFTGEGTEEKPYLISSAQDLKALSDEYDQNPEKYRDKYWKQTALIDMAGISFSPIGKDAAFEGYYDGNNFPISNLQIKSGLQKVGLFASITGETTLENIVIAETSAITATHKFASAGAVVGEIANGSSCTIRNCENHADVIGSGPKDDSFASKYANVGGIIGNANGNSLVLNCRNYGSVKLTIPSENHAGGITGRQSSMVLLAGCVNYGEVSAASAAMSSYFPTNGSSAGGITAFTYGTIVGCGNEGNVSGGQCVGGIAGLADAKVIESCYNTGNITGISETAEAGLGGIAGNSKGANLINNYHVGTVTAHAESQSTKKGAMIGSGYFAKGTKDNYFVGSSLKEAFSGTFTEAEFKPVTSAWLKSEKAIEKLNDYITPVSLYRATWEAPSENRNQGYPVIQKVEKIKSYYTELKRFSVSVGGKDYPGEINGTDIYLVLPEGVTTITPQMTLSEGASVTPANGEGVNITSGSAKFTVTAEDGVKKTTYTLHVTVPKSAGGLAGFTMKFGQVDILSESDFAQDTTEYHVTVTDEQLLRGKADLYAIPASADAVITAKVNDAEPVGVTATTSFSKGHSSLPLWSSESSGPAKPGENTITITVTPAGGGEATVYTIYMTVTSMLSDLKVYNGETELRLDKTFNRNTKEYTLNVPASVQALKLAATAMLGDAAKISFPQGTTAEGILDISKLDDIVVTVGTDTVKTAYTIHLNKKATYQASMQTSPAGGVVVVTDANGDIVEPDASKQYRLLADTTYRVRAGKYGYKTVERTITSEADLESGVLSISLEAAEAQTLPSYFGDWLSFRGSQNNMGITSAKTPMNAEEAKELWAVKGGTGWAGAPTPQLLINGQLYVQSGNKIILIDPDTGETLKSAKVAGSSTYATNPIAYGDGMLFLALDGNDGGRIQALNAETLESLWISEKIEGQMISPMTYHSGYLYTGTWYKESGIGSYFMLSTTDEDTSRTDETKQVLWKIDHKGGFYWAGAYATDKFVVFGSDDGTSEGQNAESAVLYSVNPQTGAAISKLTGLKGDIRSSIAYADGYVYFTTKAGRLYRAAIDASGNLGELKYFDMGYMSTGTPVVYNGVVFAACSGKDQFSSPGKVYAINAKTMKEITSVETPGYVQSSLLLSKAYENTSNALYLYATCNTTPGGLYAIKYAQDSQTLTLEEIYTPSGAKRQYNICSPVCDADGNIYFKNDSGYIFAVGKRDKSEEAIANVTFHLNGGSAYGITDGQTKKYFADSEGQTLPIPSKSGYTFKGWFSENSTSSTQYTLVSDKLPGTLYAFWEEVKKPTQEEGNIKVTFRLIGAEQAKQAVDLSKNTYLPNYVTWISTKSYTVKAGTTVGEVFKKALGEAGIDYHGYERNYINEIKAPTSLGGYWLGEFDNGRKSGWMYTVNGTHPNKGLVEWTLNNGDDIVWHYVNDYSFEVADWFPDPDYPSLAKDARYYNGWLKASDTVGSSGGGAAAGAVEEEVKKEVTTSGASGSAATSAPTEVKVTEKKNADGTKETVAESKVSADNQKEILKQAAEKKSAEIILEVSKTDSKGADSVQLSLEVGFVKNVSDKTDADLTVNTENGKVTLDQETIKTVLAEAKGATITLEVTKVAKPTEAQKQAAGANGHLLKLTIKSGDKVISDFNKGKVKVVAEIVSKLLDKKVAAIHIADDGKIEQLAGKVLTIGGKKFYEFTTPHFSTFALVDADELGLDVAEEAQTDVKALTAKLTPVARSAKTAKKNVKVTVSLDKQDKAIIKELKDAGYTVKYRFYRSTKKAAGYKAAVTKKTAAYTNTSGKKGTKYYYKVQVRVYDANGKLAAKTALKQCKYASRTWSKAK